MSNIDLKILGIPKSLSGYAYILSAVEIYTMLICSRDVIKVTKDIYPEVAKKYGTKAQCVERSIRFAVEAAFTKGNIDMLYDLFDNAIDERKGKVTSKVFISTLAYVAQV